MFKNTYTRLTVVLLSAVVGKTVAAETPQPWDLEQLNRPPSFQWLDQQSPIRSLTFVGEMYQGRPTDVFAFYATPGTVSGDAGRDQALPAVVLVHGGGGTAFAEWVWQWAQRGYAAIAMDLSGRRPALPRFDPATRQLIAVRDKRRLAPVRLARGGPEQGHPQKFASVGGTVFDDWPYHAVASVIRAHSLIRSFSEVDAGRTAITGISWGGYTTCLVASIDRRFRAAVPVYGCGYLYDGESVQKPAIDSLEPEQRTQWIRHYDPSSHLKNCRVPILFVNGTNDKHYPLNSYARSYGLVKGPRQLRIQVNMRHSHLAGWSPPEIHMFIDQHLRDGQPLPWLGPLRVSAENVEVVYRSQLPVKQAELHFTRDTGPLLSRRWQSQMAALEDARIKATIPAGATIWLISLTDKREAMVSSEVVFIDD